MPREVVATFPMNNFRVHLFNAIMSHKWHIINHNIWDNLNKSARQNCNSKRNKEGKNRKLSIHHLPQTSASYLRRQMQETTVHYYRIYGLMWILTKAGIATCTFSLLWKQTLGEILFVMGESLQCQTGEWQQESVLGWEINIYYVLCTFKLVYCFCFLST